MAKQSPANAQWKIVMTTWSGLQGKHAVNDTTDINFSSSVEISLEGLMGMIFFFNRKISDKNHLAKLAVVTLAAGVLTFGSVGDASAAKSGGRVGGQAFRSSGPRVSAPRSNSR